MNWVNLFDISSKKQKLIELEEKTKEAEFWNDMENSTKVLQEIKILKNKVGEFNYLESLIQDTVVLIELGIESNDVCVFWKNVLIIPVAIERIFVDD